MPLLITLNKAHYPSHDEFQRLYGHLGYHALAATASTPNVPSRDAESKQKFGFIGDGMHKVSRLGEKFPEGHCRRQSTSVLWRNWHGGPLLYQLISDAMGWTYVKALKEALRTPSQNSVVGLAVTLPAGLNSNISETPRCISFTKPNIETWKGSSAVKLLSDKSEPVTIEKKASRREMLPDSEREETRCEHLDVCGVAKSNLITLDLQAKHKKPLTHGKLVVCIGGGPPSTSGDSLIGWAADESFQSTVALPPPAVFPRCTTGALESISVDGHELDLKSAASWADGAEGAPKCGAFTLTDKNARLVAVRSASCGITHVFAM